MWDMRLSQFAVTWDVTKCVGITEKTSCLYIQRTLKINESNSYDMLANFYR